MAGGSGRVVLSVYSELLRISVTEEDADRSLPQLIEVVLSRRALDTTASSSAADTVRDLGSSLAYDAALVTLCRRLEVPETLTAGDDVSAARHRVEQLLGDRLPSIQAILGRS